MGDIFAGRYELVDPLGEGGAGVVWRVWDLKDRRYRAAKVLRQVDASSLLRFMREQSMRLEHKHVLAPTGWAGEDDKVLFTMPIIRGGSVATLVGDFGPLTVRLTATLLDQLLEALETIHAHGIVHRDVKPANLLLDATGDSWPHMWLGDFGIAAGDDAPRLTQGPYAMGTPGYTAPECLHHGWQPDSRADLFAAGRCAIEMLIGYVPEDGLSARAALNNTERSEVIPAALVDIVEALAHPAITQRYQQAGEVRRDLAAAGFLGATAAGEILGEAEVFDQIPELPDGWGPQGPHTLQPDEGQATQPTNAPAEPLVQPPTQSSTASGEQVSEHQADQPPTQPSTMSHAQTPDQSPTHSTAPSPDQAATRAISGAHPYPYQHNDQPAPQQYQAPYNAQHAGFGPQSGFPPQGPPANRLGTPLAAPGHTTEISSTTAPTRRGPGVGLAMALLLIGLGFVLIAVVGLMLLL